MIRKYKYTVTELPLSDLDEELRERAKELINLRYRKDGRIHHTLATTLLTLPRFENDSTRIFSGVNTEYQKVAADSNCAEPSAISEMSKIGDYDIDTIVTWKNLNGLGAEGRKSGIIASCSGCRSKLRNYGDPYMIVTKIDSSGSELYECKIRLSDFREDTYRER
jgi:cytidine deaminase